MTIVNLTVYLDKPYLVKTSRVLFSSFAVDDQGWYKNKFVFKFLGKWFKHEYEAPIFNGHLILSHLFCFVFFFSILPVVLWDVAGQSLFLFLSWAAWDAVDFCLSLSLYSSLICNSSSPSFPHNSRHMARVPCAFKGSDLFRISPLRPLYLKVNMSISYYLLFFFFFCRTGKTFWCTSLFECFVLYALRNLTLMQVSIFWNTSWLNILLMILQFHFLSTPI